MGREDYGAELWEVAPPQSPHAHLRINTGRGKSNSVLGKGELARGGGGGGSHSIIGSQTVKGHFPEDSRWQNVQRYVSDIYSYPEEEPSPPKYSYSNKSKQGFKSFVHEDEEPYEQSDVQQCILDARRELNLFSIPQGPDTPVRGGEWGKSELSFHSELPSYRHSFAYTNQPPDYLQSLRKSTTSPRSITSEQLTEAVEAARLETLEKQGKESWQSNDTPSDIYDGGFQKKVVLKPELKKIHVFTPDLKIGELERVIESPKAKVAESLSSVEAAALMLSKWNGEINRIEEHEAELIEPTQEELEMLHSGPGMSPTAGGDGSVVGFSPIGAGSSSAVGLSKTKEDDSGSLASGVSAQLVWHDEEEEEDQNGNESDEITEACTSQTSGQSEEIKKPPVPLAHQTSRDNEPRGDEGQDQDLIREGQRENGAHKNGEKTPMPTRQAPPPPPRAQNGDISAANKTPGQGNDDPEEADKRRGIPTHAAAVTTTASSSESPETATNGLHEHGEPSLVTLRLPPPGLREPVTLKEQERCMKWMKMMGTRGERWRHTLQRHPLKVRRRVRKGIPCKNRGLAWSLLCGGKDLFDECPGHYEEYKACTDTPWEAEIIRDITRTFPTEPFFRASEGQGQKALLSVLRAYSVYDAELGYVQGMAFLAGFLLFYMSEEQTFWSMVAVLKGAKHMPLRGIFEHGLPLAQQFFYQFERLLQSECPRLAAHFEEMGMMTSMYASQWFITLFSYSFPRDLVTRIWDIYFLEGEKILFRVALALLKEREKELVQLKFEPLFVALKQFKDETLNPNYLLPKALKLKVSKRLERYRMEWLQREDVLSNTNAVPL